MTSHVPVSSLGSDFDDFLYAPIGEDSNGMLLSVLSALARLDLEPWDEAATLARLPGNSATQRLASLIAALPDGPSARPDPGTIAARLIPLLPRRAGSNIPSRAPSRGIGAAPKSQVVEYAIYYLISMAFVLGAQYIIAGHQPPAQVEKAPAPASSAVFPQMPPSPDP